MFSVGSGASHVLALFLWTATCRNLRGACAAVITGASAEAMGAASKQHVMQMLQAGDAARRSVYAKQPAEFAAALVQHRRAAQALQGGWERISPL